MKVLDKIQYRAPIKPWMWSFILVCARAGCCGFTKWVSFPLQQETAADWEKTLIQLKSCVVLGWGVPRLRADGMLV